MIHDVAYVNHITQDSEKAHQFHSSQLLSINNTLLTLLLSTVQPF